METNRVGLELFKKILTPDARSLHLLAFGAAFGSSVWTTFFAGPISYATLPRQQFGLLMSRMAPSYLTFGAVTTSILVGTLAYDFPVIRKHPFDIMDATVYQAFTLAASAAAFIVNAAVITPASTKIMFDRHRQEKAEGKSYSDAGVSDKMETLNKEFTSLHSIGNALNLVALGGLAFHGMVRRSFCCLAWVLFWPAVAAAFTGLDEVRLLAWDDANDDWALERSTRTHGR